MDWLQRLPGVKVNHRLVMTAGISMGGDIAAALATRYDVFRQGMVLHSPCAPVYTSALLRCVPTDHLLSSLCCCSCQILAIAMCNSVRQLMISDRP